MYFLAAILSIINIIAQQTAQESSGALNWLRKNMLRAVFLCILF